MKWRFFTILILTVWLAGSAFRGTAQPNWELNPQNFEYSMTVTGRVNMDGIFSVDGNDMVAAFVNGECRGTTKLTYENFVNEYFVYLMVYSNSVPEVLTFKIFDASENEIKTANNTLDFVVNNIVGSLDSPYIFSIGELSSEAKFLNFSIPQQTGESVINDNSIQLNRSSTSSLTQIIAGFSVSEGAKVFVAGIEQVSNVTSNDFSSPVIYMIVSASLSDTTYYTVNVAIEENNPPTAIYLSNIFIAESAGSNTLVASLRAQDKDLNDSFEFSLAPGDGLTDGQNSFFGIVGNNLLLIKPLDYEVKQLLNILIRVTDSKGNTYKEAVVMQVTDENDPPAAIQLSNLNINEAAELNSVVATLNAVDPDAIDTHQFSLINGDGINDAQNNFFSIENDSLILVKPLKYDSIPFLNLLVQVTDKNGVSFQEAMVINVTNKNDPPSAVNLSNTFISESAERFTIVAVIKAEDLDLSDSHVFSLIEGNGVNDSENSFFKIVGDNLILTQPLNFEDKQKLNVLIRGTDREGAFIEQSLVLQVTDANDPPTAIKLSNTLVSESTDPNSIVAVIDVEDLDLSDTHQLDLIEGNGINDAQNSYFRIVGNNLILVQSLDFEDNQFLKVLIRVKDSGGAVLEESVVLRVTNENDPPKFNSTPISYIFQGEIYVYPILITDVDNDPITLSFENLPDWISYNTNSKFISGIPGNNEVGDYNFKIRASDGLFESVQIVSFTVININDPPEIKNYINNQQFLSNRYNEIQLPRDCILDPDVDDILIFDLSTDNNTSLPEWLNFNKETLTVSGTPPMGTQTAIKLKLTATDKGKLKEWIAFELLVSIPTAVNVEENTNLFTVYPNPVSEKLHIVLPRGKEKANVSVLNFAGQVLQQFKMDTESTNTVSFGSFPPGVYFVCLAQGNMSQIRKIVKK